MPEFLPATRPTLHFIGVTTGQSSIMKVFPAWAEALGIDAVIRGMDFPPDDDPANYRRAVSFIAVDPLSRGALVTTHKVNLLKASRDLFAELDPLATTLGEVSCISKRGHRLVGHAKDPISAGHALAAIVPEGHWKASGAEMMILGSGGAALALTLHLHTRATAGADVPSRLTITAVDAAQLDEMRHMHQRIGFAIPVRYELTASATDADQLVASLPPASLVVNATGLGKDRPGSPLSDGVRFPDRAIVWEFNYRGDLRFLHQAEAQREARDLAVTDGWDYFIHGWTRVIAEVFDIEIQTAGPQFETLSRIARDVSGR